MKKSAYISNKSHILPLVVLLLLVSSGCSKFNCTPLENYVGSNTDLISFSYSIADTLTATASPTLVANHPDMPLVVTTFVDNNNLEKTSKFGRILQEHISSRLVQLGYSVREIKMTGKLQIEPLSGETILSRDLAKLSPTIKSQAILVGTISATSRTLYVTARFVNPANNAIISSTDHQVCMDDNILAMFGLMRETSTGEIEEPPRSPLNSILY